jgi:hypothetical protein
VDLDESSEHRLRDRDARLAAFSMMYGNACLQLLRSHGHSQAAEQFSAALETLKQIFSEGIGEERLAQTLDWVSSEIWGTGVFSEPSRARH